MCVVLCGALCSFLVQFFIVSPLNQDRDMEEIERTVLCLLAASLWIGTSAVAPLPEEGLNVVSRV